MASSEAAVTAPPAENPDIPAKSTTAIDGLDTMTDRYTNEEWANQIAETEKKVTDKKETKRKYDAPAPGSKVFAETIDHTLLKLDATPSQIDTLCSEARTEGFKSVCVRLPYVSRCVANLKGTSVVVACVVGFHEGTYDTYAKLKEAREAVAAGASELDVVINYSILTAANQPPTSKSEKRNTATITAENTVVNTKPSGVRTPPAVGPYSVSGSNHSRNSSKASTITNGKDSIPDYSAIYRELAGIRSLCPSPVVLKLIFETSQLTPSQIVAASHLAAAANFDFIKTSTGFNGRGATLEDVELMSAAAEYLSTKNKKNGGSPVRQSRMQVKASGGIRSLADAMKMLEAGATRLGTSSGLWIMQESRKADNGRPAATRLYTDDSVY